MQHTPRLNRPSLLSMQHNYESQDGDGESKNGGIAEQVESAGQQSEGLPMMRRVHSYSGAGAGAGAVEGRASIAEGGSWDEGQGRGTGFGFTPSVTVEGVDRRAVSALGPSFGTGSVNAEITGPTRSISMHAIPSFGSRPADSSVPASATGLLVGPSIPLALRRASSDQFPGTNDTGRGGEEGDVKRKDRGFTGAAVHTGFTTDWATPRVGFGKQPSTPPKGSASIASAAIGNISFNSGSPSNNTPGGSMMMSTTPVRSSAGMGLRARANSGSRLRNASGAFGNASRHPPLPPSLRATLAADKDLPSSEIRSEALLQRVIFSNPDSLPMTPKPSRRHQQQQQQYTQFGAATNGTGTPGGALFAGNMNMFSGNGYAGRTAARPPRFLDSAASTIDSDDEDEMDDSSDEEAQFAVDDIMDVGGASVGNGTGPASRSGSGSGSASGSVSLGLAGPGRTSSNAGTESGMEVDVPMTSGGGVGLGKLSNRTSMTSLRGFAGVDSEDSGGSAQNKNMTAWRESPSSTSNRAQKRKAGHDDSRYEPYGKRHRGDGPLSPLQWTSALPGASVPPIPISPSKQYTAHHNPHFPPSVAAGGPSGSASSAGTGVGSEGGIMQTDAASGLALNKYGYPSVAIATVRSRAGSPVANTYAAMRTAVSPVASSPLSMMSGMGISGLSGGHPPAAYRPPSSSSSAGAGGTTIGMNGMGGLGMLLLSKRHATNPGGTGMGLVSMGDDSGEMEVAEGIHGMDVTEHGAHSQTRDDDDDKMMFD